MHPEFSMERGGLACAYGNGEDIKVLSKPEGTVSSILFYSIKTLSHCDVFFWPESPLLLWFVLFYLLHFTNRK